VILFLFCTDHVQTTGKLYHLRLRVECTNIHGNCIDISGVLINQSTNHICNVYFFVQLIYYNGCLFFVCIFDFFCGGDFVFVLMFLFLFLFLFLSYIIAIRNNFICALKLLIFILSNIWLWSISSRVCTNGLAYIHTIRLSMVKGGGPEVFNCLDINIYALMFCCLENFLF
jgi:hypothetical protein